ncbi:hypothetical protein RRG08_018108 [Elysia crispata]|uniref:Uncharacterized protein n=1 Tax=Elysia crispata TaxID=231223 RepID=A0AAE0ZDF4_9GAST|nr:hypothetical protein RRG08_018108 [Elysia crispata]
MEEDEVHSPFFLNLTTLRPADSDTRLRSEIRLQAPPTCVNSSAGICGLTRNQIVLGFRVSGGVFDRQPRTSSAPALVKSAQKWQTDFPSSYLRNN